MLGGRVTKATKRMSLTQTGPTSSSQGLPQLDLWEIKGKINESLASVKSETCTSAKSLTTEPPPQVSASLTNDWLQRLSCEMKNNNPSFKAIPQGRGRGGEKEWSI